MTRAVVFDMDGVLISSEEIWDDVREGLTAELGGTWRPSAHRDMMGLSTPEWTGYMHTELGVPRTPEQIAAMVVERLIARYRADPPVIDGVVEAVRALAARYPLGVASSSTRTLIDAVLDQTGLTECFTATVSSEEVARGKPSPDVYLRALELLGVAPADAVAVEDTGGGIRAAAAAGMHVIAIPNPHYPPASEALALADRVLDSIHDLPGAIPD
ncbi:HAD family hydrolase [Miltoncostaea oceani]|uniref:HAD family hydrolase n=1 Tax=Miltoncostaea oceani TaxID=2843216 RepID=UPI001C3C8582|nr:HAD family phosphatase [Miltoncostaea oceani]